MQFHGCFKIQIKENDIKNKSLVIGAQNNSMRTNYIKD